MTKPFAINQHGRMVFPSNFHPELDFSCMESEEQLAAVVRRDFEAKAPTGTDILEKVNAGTYASRYELLRDVALNLFWANRYVLTMYEKRPTRWRDVPRHRDDLFLPDLRPWKDGEDKVAAVGRAYDALPATWDAEAEQRIYDLLYHVYRYKLHHATELSPIKQTVAEFIDTPELLTYCLPDYNPDFPMFTEQQILNCSEAQPELEALMRMAMVQHNQYPWDRDTIRLAHASEIGGDEFVVLLVPRSREVREFIHRCRTGRSIAGAPDLRHFSRKVEAVQPARPIPPQNVTTECAVQARIESLAVYKGEHLCRNEDLIRNAAYSWSPMTADEITEKTGIESRIYTEHSLEEMALRAARSALHAAGRDPSEIANVLFCSCTSTRLIPSVATWLSGELGIFQTMGSFDVVAACAGFPYGIADAVRIMQHTHAPVLLVCGEKFSDKIGNVRPSRMIFGDGAAAMVLAPTLDGEPGDVEFLQTYASGPTSQVNSIIWPNAEFDNDITVWGPEVKALVARYLTQMMGELKSLPTPGGEGALLDSIDLIVPHQANRTMVTDLAVEAGMDAERLYFDIDRVGNVSAASIPIAIHDAVEDGVITDRTRVFAPGFGAGAVAGYAVVHIDPAVVVLEGQDSTEHPARTPEDRAPIPDTSLQAVKEAFG
ncbi:MAG: 3-oxoacyl-[acyl-carrier-protein] synthase III C-terminal domain-containing protein [Thermoleophilia bacterium]